MSDVAARVPFAFAETTWLRAVPVAARFVFRGDETARLAAAASFGVSLAADVGRAATHGARAALSLGPDEQLFIVPEHEAGTFAADLGRALAGWPHSLVDVGHRQVAFELHGAHAAWLLAAECPLPLDLESFTVDACTRTVFAKAGIMLWRTRPDVFRIEVARSYGRYVVELLGEVARELPEDRGDT